MAESADRNAPATGEGDAGGTPARPLDDLGFRSSSVWAFYRSVVVRYWRRFVGMIVLMGFYSGVTVARLGAFAIIVALLRYTWSNGDPEDIPDILVGLSNGYELLIGSPIDFAQLRDPAKGKDLLFAVLGVFLGGFGFLAVLSSISMFFKDYLAQSIIFRGAADVREALFRHLTSQSVAYYNRRHSGDVISRLTNDVSTVQLSFRFFFQDLVQPPIRIVSMMAVACLAIPWMFWLSPLLYGVIMWPMFRAGKKVIRHGRGRQKKLGIVTEAIHQLFSGIRVVKAFGMEDHEKRRFEEKSRELVKSSLRMVRAKAKGRSWQELLFNLGVGLFIFVAVWLLASGGVEIEALLLFIGALIESYHPIKAISKAYNVLMESRAGVERVIEVLEQEGEPGDDASLPAFPGLEHEVRFEGVSFSYDDVEPASAETSAAESAMGELAPNSAAEGEASTAVDAQAAGDGDEDDDGSSLADGERPFPGVIRDVSLAVSAGEVIALVGPSGAGKSTLVDLLARFYDPQQGCILADDVDIRGYRRSSYRDAIAVVSQDPFLFHDTIRENIRYGRSGSTDADVEHAAAVAFAHEFILEQPHGYDTVIGERGVKLSGGQRQRLTIARAVLKDAPILILDEATSSLDTQSEREVQRAMDNLMRDRTTFVIAHRLSTIVGADQIVVLDDGSVVEHGKHEELLGRRGAYWRLWESQSAGAAG